MLKALRDTRLAPELAKELLGASVRKAFMGFITRSRNKPNRLEAAKELKALVYFSNVCVTPLLEDINVRPILFLKRLDSQPRRHLLPVPILVETNVLHYCSVCRFDDLQYHACVAAFESQTMSSPGSVCSSTLCQSCMHMRCMVKGQ